MKKMRKGLILLLAASGLGASAFTLKETIHKLNISTPDDLRAYFSYSKKDHFPVVSTHRGGSEPGYPEECIKTFEHTLMGTPSTLEIDPRFTKDSVMVLVHDPKLDRATTGSGLVADHTWEELQQLHLKDKDGKVTSYRIPTLDAVLEWAKGKTVVFMDKKDIPWNFLEQKIHQHGAEANAVVMVHEMDDARNYYQANKNIMLEIEVLDKERVLEIDKSGVPWKNIIAYVGFSKPDNKELFDMIHERGSMCLYKAGRVCDKEFKKGNTGIYDELVRNGVDVVETNFPTEVYHSISKFWPKSSAKYKFFGKADLKN